MYILDKIQETIAEPRADLKPHAPRIVTMSIPKDCIGAVIGPGGKIIQEIQSSTGTIITIDEVDNEGKVEVVAANKDSIDAAIARIKGIVAVPEVGEIYKGKIKSVVTFGVFVEILPGKEGLLHISEIEWRRFEKIEDAGLKEGDEIEVKLLEIDKAGKLRLSHKALLPKPEGYAERPERGERRNNGDRRDNRHG